MSKFLFYLLIAVCTPIISFAQSHCIALSDRSAIIHYASLTSTLAPDSIRIRFIGHSMYHIETPDGVTAVTDYSGYIGQNVKAPDIVTMNQAHSSHYTDYPDPKVPNVLRGWDPNGGVAKHNFGLKDLLVRNVTSDIRSNYTGSIPDGNSIFIFEVAGLCIGHLGHLHQPLSEEQYAAIGRLDVVMVPVDGGMTMAVGEMIKIMKRVKASIVLPMHWFGQSTLSIFLQGMRDSFAIQRVSESYLITSLRDLPRRPTVIVLEPELPHDLYE